MADCNDLAITADKLGASPCLVNYLRARGISTLAILATFATSKEEITDTITRRFINGTQIKKMTHKCRDDEEVTIATVLAMWEAARASYHRDIRAPLDFAQAMTTDCAPTSVPLGLWKTQIGR